MLQNAYFLAKIGADTAENEQHFAKILPTDALLRLRRASLGTAVAGGPADLAGALNRAELIDGIDTDGCRWRNGPCMHSFSDNISRILTDVHKNIQI